MKDKIHILLIEDSDDDALLNIIEIKKGGHNISYERVETEEDLRSALNSNTCDIILADYRMPNFTGLEALSIVKEYELDIPFIIISGTIGEDLAVDAMKAGAHDYILKNNLKRLLPAVERELKEAEIRLERKLLEEKKKKAEEKLKVLSYAVEQNPAMIIITDTEGNIEYTNQKFEDVTGYSVQEIVGKKPSIVKSGMMPDSLYKNMWDTIKSGKVWHNELINKKRTGDLYWVNISISPIIDDAGNISHFVSVAEDITQKKEIEKELIIAKEHAEESDRLKSAFLQNMSHEIRTPMNAIIGFSRLIVSEYNNKEKLEEYSKIITYSCKDLLEIIDTVLDMAKIESKQLHIERDEFNLKTFFDRLTLFFDEYKIQKNKEHIELVLHSQENNSESLVIRTDLVKLKQIFINLISNAIKFTESGKIIGGYKYDENQDLVFFVSDTGIGIPSGKQDIIFNRFEKLNQKDFIEGTGLGLAIVRELLDYLGGTIWVESSPSKGTTFYFNYPLEIIRK